MDNEASQVNQNSFKEVSDKADRTLSTKPFMPVNHATWEEQKCENTFLYPAARSRIL